MKKISITNLPLNTYISKPVFLDEGYILLSPNTPITEDLVNRLRNWGYASVLSDGIPNEQPTINGTTEPEAQTAIIEKDLAEKKKTDEIMAFYTETIGFLAKTFADFQAKGTLRITPISDQVKKIIDYVKHDRRYILNLPEQETEKSNYLIYHSVRVTILATALAEFLKFPPHKQIDVGVAAMLHKIGMLRIPTDIYMNNRPLTPKEKQTITAYPVIGFKILKTAEFPTPICLGVLDHHENCDGSGYPRGLTADKIHIYGKLLSVACTYDAATSHRPYRDGQDAHSGIMDVLKGSGRQYDERIIRALVFTLSLYPLGTYVQLSDGSRGIVIKTVRENPKYPIVRLLLKGDGQKYYDKPMLHTSAESEMQIVRSLSKNEIEEMKNQL